MLRRVLKCFESQTYPAKSLYSLNTVGVDGPVGDLRNRANTEAVKFHPDAQYFAHFDDDDWSAPSRLDEQVDALQRNPEAVCVGYGDMPIYDTRTGELWHYGWGRPWVLGTSMLYTVESWRKTPFKPIMRASDVAWQNKHLERIATLPNVQDGAARMIATVHGKNLGLDTFLEKERGSKQCAAVDVDSDLYRYVVKTLGTQTAPLPT